MRDAENLVRRRASRMAKKSKRAKAAKRIEAGELASRQELILFLDRTREQRGMTRTALGEALRKCGWRVERPDKLLSDVFGGHNRVPQPIMPLLPQVLAFQEAEEREWIRLTDFMRRRIEHATKEYPAGDKTPGGSERQPTVLELFSVQFPTIYFARNAESSTIDKWHDQAARGPRRMLVVEAVGGQGKSTLVWSWFDGARARLVDAHTHVFTYSFYAGDSARGVPHQFRTFAAALLQVLEGAVSPPMPPPLLLERLRAALQHPAHRVFLLLDGVERVLAAYRSAENDDDLDRPSVPDERQWMKRSLEPEYDDLFRLLLNSGNCVTLMTTRLTPNVLETRTGLDGRCEWLHLSGLNKADGIEFLRSGIGLKEIEVVAAGHIVDRCGGHPLTLGILIGAWRTERPPGLAFSQWLMQRGLKSLVELDREFPIKQCKSQVLSAALDALSADEFVVLAIFGAFRWSTDGRLASEVAGRMGLGHEIKRTMRSLQSRSLLTYDHANGVYEMHALVRRLAARLGLQRYPRIADAFRDRITSAAMESRNEAELEPQRALYSCLVDLGRIDEAYHVYNNNIQHFYSFRTNGAAQRVFDLSLLQDDLETEPRFPQDSMRASWHADKAFAQLFLGRLGVAIEHLEVVRKIFDGDSGNLILLNEWLYLVELYRYRGKIDAALSTAEVALNSVAGLQLVIKKDRKKQNFVKLKIFVFWMLVRSMLGPIDLDRLWRLLGQFNASGLDSILEAWLYIKCADIALQQGALETAQVLTNAANRIVSKGEYGAQSIEILRLRMEWLSMQGRHAEVLDIAEGCNVQIQEYDLDQETCRIRLCQAEALLQTGASLVAKEYLRQVQEVTAEFLGFQPLYHAMCKANGIEIVGTQDHGPSNWWINNRMSWYKGWNAQSAINGNAAARINNFQGEAERVLSSSSKKPRRLPVFLSLLAT